MNLSLIRAVIFAILLQKISTTMTETKNTNKLENNFHDDAADSNENSRETQLDRLDDTSNSTSQISQDRISFHAKRGAPFPHYPIHHHHQGHNAHHSHPYQYARPNFHLKPRKKRRKGHKKLGSSMGKPFFVKMPPFPKRLKKSHTLQEMFQPAGSFPHPKVKFMNPSIRDYVEEDEIFAHPFSAAENIESFPGAFSKFGRPPPSIEISDDGPEGIQSIGPIEEEIILPGPTSIKPFSSVIKKPMQLGAAIFSPTKPPDIFMDEDLQSSIRNVRLAKPHRNSYVDKDIINLLTKLKAEGLHLNSEPPAEEPSKENVTDVNAAISKLLSPFLSETAVKQIQSYFNKPKDNKETEEKNLTKIVYIIENGEKDTRENPSNHRPYRSYSITDPIHENDTNNTTYFIMVKSPHAANSSAGSLQKSKKYVDHTTPQSEVSTSTPPSMQSLALQNYIMSLAGIRSPADNYLSHFNSFNARNHGDSYSNK